VLNGVDWLLLGVIALSALMGLMRGLVVEVLSLVVWIAAFWLAFVYGDAVSVLFSNVIATPSARLLLSYAVVFVAALLIGGIVTWLVGRLMKATGLGGIDRLLGLVFGLLRGAALACVLVLLFGFTTMPQDALWRESRLLPEFQVGAQAMRSWLPDAVAPYVQFGSKRKTAPPRSKAPAASGQ
jgi:membrane protein required for colicin V production